MQRGQCGWAGAALGLCFLGAALSVSAQSINEAAGFVAFEAESVTTNVSPRSGFTWVTGSAVPGFSGASYLEASPNSGATIDADWVTNSPELRYTINFTTPGTYYVWVRGNAAVNTDATLHAGLDGVSDTAARMTLDQLNGWGWSNAIVGSSARATIVVTTAGAHTFSVWMRDDGLRLDRIILTTNSNYSPELSADFWRNQNIYQLLTDRFYNGDPTNDNAAGNFNATSGTGVHGGDFRGIEQKLDYLKALGVTAIWISPIVLNANGEYHGYAGRDFYQVDPHWGSLADLQRMIQAAHQRGLLVINDVVVNHGGDLIDSGTSGYPNFLAPPGGYTLRFRNSGKQYPAPFNLNATNPTIESLFHNNGTIQNYGDLTQVERGELAGLDDFRTESAYVRAQMAAIYQYWIQQVGFDGFRIDTVKHVEAGFWQSWSPAIRQAAIALDRPNFFQFGEVYDGSDSKCGYYTGTKSGPAFLLESVVDYPLYFRVNSVFATATGNTQQIEDRYNQLAANYNASAQNQLVTFLDNHDQPRFLSSGNANGNTANLDVALAFLYTSRGIPCLYYGTEQAFDGGADPADREDMFAGGYEQGPSVGDNFDMASPQFVLVAKLNNFRRLYPALRTGSHVNQWNDPTGPGLFAYSRRLGAEEAYVILNTAGSAKTIPSRPTIHPAGTVVVNLFNPAETYTVSAVPEIPSIVMPAKSYKIFVAQTALLPLDPAVIDVAPVHDASNIATLSPIVLTFSKPMNPATVQAAFSTSPASTGTFTWSAANDRMTFQPAGSGLAVSTTYTVRLAASATDSVSGHAFVAPFESRFKTGTTSTPSFPPTNTTIAATGLGTTSATLNATINPNGAATSVYFQYGRTTGYGSTTAVQNLGSGTAALPVSANVTGLQTNRTYHFRAVATNSNGTTNGTDRSFVTPSTAPLTTATTNAATNVTISSATVNGTANPGGVISTAVFQYGVAPNTLSSTTTAQSLGSGTANVNVSAALSGLSSNTTYYYRLAVTNTNGTTLGSTLVFTTPTLQPTAVTLPAGSLSTTGAVLNASVNPNGSPTSAQFEYGLTTAYGSIAAAQPDPGTGISPVALNAALSGLNPGTTYHYRITATNPNGNGSGADQTFTTSFPAPVVVTTAATTPSLSGATLNGLVHAGGTPTAGWFEYGLTTSYTNTTRASAADNAETYTTWNYTTANNGGSGFGPATLLEGTGGGLYLASSTTGNRQVDGAKSFGVYAGSGGQALTRALTNPRAAGTLTFSARFDLSNRLGFSGVSIRSAQGTSFSANDLVSFGLNPSSGNNGILVRGSVNQTIPLGVELRGALVDFKLDFNTATGTYTLGAKLRASAGFTSVSGSLKAIGATATHLGFANFNNDGNNQNLILDSLQVLTADSLGAATSAVPLSRSVTGLTANTLYHFRAVALNATGLTYGPDLTFVTTPLTALEQWRQSNFGTTNAADPVAGNAVDADLDGLGNLLEYALGTNPNRADSFKLPVRGQVNAGGIDYSTLTFRRLRAASPGVTYFVEESADLLTWSAVDAVANLVAGPTDQLDGTDSVTVRGSLPLGTGRSFLRLRVIAP